MKKTLIESFTEIKDPRESNISHALIDIILIGVLATNPRNFWSYDNIANYFL